MDEASEKVLLQTAHYVLDKESKAILEISQNIGDTFIQIVETILECTGKVVFTGMGKSGHIAKKIAATMSSLGIPSLFMHPGEAMHGDLGVLESNDVVVAISYSGETAEIIDIIPSIRIIGSRLISITNNRESTLSKKSDIAEILPKIKEACHLGLAPTSSTTSTLAYGDALAVAISKYIDFSKNDFGVFHPAGSLGRKLIYRVSDLMNELTSPEYLYEDSSIAVAISAMMINGYGILPIITQSHELIGVITNECLKRELLKKEDLHITSIKDIIIPNPIYTTSDTMAIDVLQLFEKYNISAVPVVNDDRVLGIIKKDTIISKGIRL